MNSVDLPATTDFCAALIIKEFARKTNLSLHHSKAFMTHAVQAIQHVAIRHGRVDLSVFGDSVVGAYAAHQYPDVALMEGGMDNEAGADYRGRETGI
ncbi:hypothetical protein [Paenibacillus sp. y28]|uniref:hypothetical protein n=1 Tax=Paenibacillus sp. y28 TaxID=3129110 RepID=UPI00301B1FCD